MIGNVKKSTHGIYDAISDKRLPRYLAKFCYRFDRRFKLEDMIPRLGYAAVRTPPMPEGLLRVAEAWGNQEGVLGVEMGEDLLDHHRVFSALASCVALPPASLQSDADNDPQRPAAGRTGLDADVEDKLWPLRLYALRVQVIAAWRSAGVLSCPSSEALGWAPFPRSPGVTDAWYWLLHRGAEQIS